LILGQQLADIGLTPGRLPERDQVAIKAPVFSFNKLPQAPTVLSPEMKSTGETIGVGPTFASAWHAAMADSYQLDHWQASDGILLDSVTWQQPTVQEMLKTTNIPITIIESTSQWPTTTRALGFTLDSTPDHPFATAILNHGLPLVTALDTLKTLLTVTV